MQVASRTFAGIAKVCETLQVGSTLAQQDGESSEANACEAQLASTGQAEPRGLQLTKASSLKVVVECAELTLESNPTLEPGHRVVWRTRELAALMVTDGHGILASQVGFADVVVELHDCTLPAHAKRSHPFHFVDENALVRGIDRSLSAPIVSQYSTFGRAGRQFQMKEGSAAPPRSNGHHGRRSYDLHPGEEVREFHIFLPSLIHIFANNQMLKLHFCRCFF